MKAKMFGRLVGAVADSKEASRNKQTSTSKRHKIGPEKERKQARFYPLRVCSHPTCGSGTVLSKTRWLPIIFLGLIYGIFAIAETERNNTLGTSNVLPLQGNQTGTIDPAGEYDWYQIALPGAGRLLFSVTDPPANMRTEMALYGRHAQWISVYSNAINDGDDVFLSVDITEAGHYFIRIRDLNSRVSSGSYRLVNQFVAVTDANEPNNVIGQATQMQSSQIQGSIFSGGEYDFYRVYVDEGSTLAFSLTPPDAMRAELALYNPNLNWMSRYNTAINEGDEVFLETEIDASGFYYLRVRDMHNRAHTESYRLSVSGARVGFVPPETASSTESEPNFDSSVADRIPLNSAIKGTIGEAGDVDWKLPNQVN